MSALMAMAVLRGSKTRAMGSIMGLMAMAHSMGMMIGSIFAGLMMDAFNLNHAFSFGSIIMLSGTILFVIFTYKKKIEVSSIITQEG